MGRIKTIVFDLGGVVITLDQPQAIRRFEALGLQEAKEQLDAYVQKGIFGELEKGTITAEVFRSELSRLIGREVSHAECAYAWQGYAKEVPERNLRALKELRRQGYRLLLLSNTNPYMMEWVDSERFDGKGHAISAYFDRLYLSYRMKMMKPDELIFRSMLMEEQTTPSEVLFVDDGVRNVAAASQLGMQTLCPENGADWTKDLFELLND
jgi:putative hydrolase of the HAD superfamily